MQCPTCGSAIEPGDSFCPKCGADVRAITQAPPPPPPPGIFAAETPGASAQPVAPPQEVASQPAPSAPSPEPPPFPGQQAGLASYPAAQPTQPIPQPIPQAYPAQLQAAQAPQGAAATGKRGISGGAIVAIVSAVVVGVILLGVGSVFALRAFAPRGEQSGAIVAKPDPSKLAATATTPAASDAESSSAEASATSSAGSAPGASQASPADAVPPADTSAIPEEADPGPVTDAEARDIVKKFMDLRVAHKINASKQYCSKKMLTGENGSFINDKYWRPDSYKIKKTTPDLMYIHVAVMGLWPSGWEPTIYSVWRDPKSGKVVIDDMLDPDSNPKLWK